MTTTGQAVPTPTDLEKATIGAFTQRVIAAWAYNDADGFADMFVENGTMILAGEFHDGREQIRKYLTEAYQGKYKGTQVTGKPISIRMLGPDAALLLSQGGVLQPGESEVSADGAVRASWTVVRQDGQWRLAAYQNTPVKPV